MKKKILTIGIVFFLLLFGWALYENKVLQVTEYEIDCSSHPELAGFTIVQISDLHNEEFGEGQKKLLNMVSECNPDMIAITGDFIDCRHPNVDIAMEFIEGALDIAPVYYIPGNHERWVSKEYKNLCQRMEDAGVHLMTDIQEPLLYNNNEIVCMGIKDPDFYDAAESDTKKILTKEVITEFEYTEEDFTLLLSHRPELFDIYTEAGIDLILTGHAHGGQFRFPFIGGLAAPNQGLFPKYDAGVFSENDRQYTGPCGQRGHAYPLWHCCQQNGGAGVPQRPVPAG